MASDAALARAWLRPALEVPLFSESSGPGGAEEGELVLEWIAEAAHAWALATMAAAAENGRLWVLVSHPRHLERVAEELELWRTPMLVLRGGMNLTGAAPDPEAVAERVATLTKLAAGEPGLVLADPAVLLEPAPSPAALHAARRVVAAGTELDPVAFAGELSAQGYERVSQVAGRGQFAVRGGIVDVFPWQAMAPLRIEWFDDRVESVREFDLDTQMSTRRMERVEIALGEAETDAIIGDYRAAGDRVVTIDATEPEAAVRVFSGASGRVDVAEHPLVAHASPLGRFEAGDFVLHELRREAFFSQLEAWRRDAWSVAMVFGNRGEEERFAELAGRSLADLALTPLRGEMLESFAVPALRLAVLSSSELFGRYRNPGSGRRQRLERARAATAIVAAEEIAEGDLVVHADYGIGRFQGIDRDDDGEHLAIEYREGAMLHVPLDQAHLVGKYTGLGGKAPDLNKLGGTAWKTARRNAEQAILDYAARLLRVQAERRSLPGHPHPPDSRWMWEFENSFHFTETPDQLRAIEESKRDMETARPMDRLICGDVGFGKTEVAIRAAFKTVTGGKQVAVLVPTTVLAEQHWRTFRERMSEYPVRIDLLSRFRTPSEIRATLAGVSDGSVDIVIGTHRLVSPDVRFKDLGLIVIDEEQRFGVQHKERFKELFRQIDVLTLSATPIPRTLYLALMGARDMSTIETPPPNRTPVHTVVAAYDERLIRDAIRRELRRGGQVFFLHNRVRTIDGMRQRLAELVPEARIVTGHGQMDKDDLEQVMHAFVRGDADVLLATTIIETGIDIPNANTILIDRADRFGLADLYQLRGRVGRAGEQAYAILLLPRDMMTAGDARKRLSAIRQHTALGSGFKIAMRDLEIRGAGNLLGTRQSGQIAAVGFDLYCQLLRQSINRLQGGAATPRTVCVFKADFVRFHEGVAGKDGGDQLPAGLPVEWLPEARVRVAAFRELAEAGDEAAVRALETRWRDRFGRLPAAVGNLLAIARIKALAADKGVGSVEIQGQRLMLQRHGDYILLEGRRFPRLQATKPAAKLTEAEQLLRTL